MPSLGNVRSLGAQSEPERHAEPLHYPQAKVQVPVLFGEQAPDDPVVNAQLGRNLGFGNVGLFDVLNDDVSQLGSQTSPRGHSPSVNHNVSSVHTAELTIVI